MNKKQRRMVRIIAIVLAVLLAGSAVISAIFSLAYAEEAMPEKNQYALTMEYLANEQALRVSQRLVYTNVSDVHLDRVIFYAPANMLRRQSALMYEAADLADTFPAGYVPGGIDLVSVQVDQQNVDWGFQGENEIYLRVSCDLDPGEKCTFDFEYYLLVTENRAFIGVDENNWRLSNFYFAPADVDDGRGEFILNSPIAFSEYIETPAADFTAEIILPDLYLLSATGREQAEVLDKHSIRWNIDVQNCYDFSLCFVYRYQESLRETASGVQLRCLTNIRGAASRILETAEEAISTCERWFGPLPIDQLDFVQAGSSRDCMVNSGAVWLSEELIKGDKDALEHAIRFSVAKQYFGLRARARVSSDAWLSDSVCEYLSYLMLEDAAGHDAYLKALNENLVASLQLTIPGGLVVTSDAALFEEYEYEIVIRNRGAAVFHELRTAMGLDEIISGFSNFYHLGLEKDILTEMDLVDAMDKASGASWEKFLTDWVFNIGDYVNQTIGWLD